MVKKNLTTVKKVTKKTTTKAKSSKKQTVTSGELQGLIAKRAYELYLDRNGVNGEDQADWYQAEKQVKSKIKSTK
ncbi:DUF2934 domain-containing protein [Candidatus Auribacterota bacterium]